MKSTLLYLILIIFAGFISIKLPAQSPIRFQKTYGSPSIEHIFSVAQTSDGGYILCGEKGVDSTNTDVFLVRTNSLGDTLWTRCFGGSLGDFGESVIQTRDGGFILTGITNSFGAGLADVYVVRTNAMGDTLWTKTYGAAAGDEYGQFIQQTSDGGYLVTGHTDSFGTRGDFYVVRTDSLGDTLWTRHYGGIKHDHGFCGIQTSDGGYLFGGHSVSFGPWGGFYAIKTNALGDTLWSKGYGGPYGDSFCFSVIQTDEGGYLFAGYTNSFGAGASDGWIVKTNALGDTLWTRTYGGSGSDICNAVIQTPDHGFALVGTTDSYGFGGQDIYLLKTDSTGLPHWSNTYGGTGNDNGFTLARTGDGGFVIGGTTNSYGAGDYDAFLLKTDSAGHTLCHDQGCSFTSLQASPLFVNVMASGNPTASHVGPTHSFLGKGTGINDACLESGIEEHAFRNGVLLLYPNPSRGILNLKTDSNPGFVRIIDPTGRILYFVSLNVSSTSLDLTGLSPGLYILETAKNHSFFILN